MTGISLINLFNEEELSESSIKNKTILYLYLSYIYLHLDSSEKAKKFKKIDIENNFFESKEIIFNELVLNYSYNHTALIITNRKNSTVIGLGNCDLDRIKFFYENLSLIADASYKKMNEICRKIRPHIYCFESVFLSELIHQPYNLKKGNLFKFLVLEFVIQSCYLCDYLAINEKYHEEQILNKISIDFLKIVKKNISNFDYKINLIISDYTNVTKNCISQRKNNITKRNEEKSLDILRKEKINNSKFYSDLEINKINKGNIKYPEAIQFFKRNLSDRKIIPSKEYLNEIILKTINQTKDIYWRNLKENIAPSEVRLILEKWIATEFKSFCEKKGIKFHNMILVFILQCQSSL